MKELLNRVGETNICPQIILVRDGKFLAGHRHYQTASVWTTPGGRCDPGETIEETLRREVYEEVGIKDFKIDSYIGTFKGSYKDDQVPFFIGTSDEEPVLQEPEKFSEWRYVTLSEVRDTFNSKDKPELMQKLASLFQ